MRRVCAVIVLCLCTVLTGCGTVLDDRATPDPVELGNASVLAGITADGVDASTLAATHDAVLGATSYTVRVSEVITRNGTVLRNASLRAVVDGRGYVRRYRYAYDADASSVSGSVRVVRRVRFVDVGATTVERPGRADGA